MCVRDVTESEGFARFSNKEQNPDDAGASSQCAVSQAPSEARLPLTLQAVLGPHTLWYQRRLSHFTDGEMQASLSHRPTAPPPEGACSMGFQSPLCCCRFWAGLEPPSLPPRPPPLSIFSKVDHGGAGGLSLCGHVEAAAAEGSSPLKCDPLCVGRQTQKESAQHPSTSTSTPGICHMEGTWALPLALEAPPWGTRQKASWLGRLLRKMWLNPELGGVQSPG